MTQKPYDRWLCGVNITLTWLMFPLFLATGAGRGSEVTGTLVERIMTVLAAKPGLLFLPVVHTVVLLLVQRWLKADYLSLLAQAIFLILEVCLLLYILPLL
ncbi:MAG: hypothetical protein SFY92_06040 [Verrucomicrobiae bacterium]|nr:hypothetical protein [Verrucomicrobiae bacterium]